MPVSLKAMTYFTTALRHENIAKAHSGNLPQN